MTTCNTCLDNDASICIACAFARTLNSIDSLTSNLFEIESERDALRAECDRLRARVAELEAHDVDTVPRRWFENYLDICDDLYDIIDEHAVEHDDEHGAGLRTRVRNLVNERESLRARVAELEVALSYTEFARLNRLIEQLRADLAAEKRRAGTLENEVPGDPQ